MIANDSVMLQAVIVLYKVSPAQSHTLSSLQNILHTDPATLRPIKLLVYDNSPFPQPLGNITFSDPIDYHHDSSNKGLAQAYNTALRHAVRDNIPWLLLLDQDATLTVAFLKELLSTIKGGTASDICAIVPQLVREGLALSPLLLKNSREHVVPPGLAIHPVTVLNSAACIRVSSLIAIGGFPEEFPLDYLDHVVFHRLQANAGRVLVMPVGIEHQLSVRGREGELGLDRYQRMLNAEWAFNREVKPKGGRPLQRIRLLVRALQQLKLRDKRYAWYTFGAAFK